MGISNSGLAAEITVMYTFLCRCIAGLNLNGEGVIFIVIPLKRTAGLSTGLQRRWCSLTIQLE